MAIGESLPWPMGNTFFNGGTADASSGDQYEGQEYLTPDIDMSTGQRRSNKIKRLRVVRNVSTVALLGKRLVKFKKSGASTYGLEVDGYATGNAVAPGGDEGFPLDEFLPSTGLAVNDLGYVVMEGPAMCTTTFDNSQSGVDIAVGGRVAVAMTAAGTTGITAGRIEAITVSNHTDQTAATLVQSIQAFANCIGRAMTAALTTGTNTTVLVDICKW